MSTGPIRVVVVDANPGEGQVLSVRLGEIEGVEVVGVAHNRNAAKAEAEALRPECVPGRSDAARLSQHRYRLVDQVTCTSQ